MFASTLRCTRVTPPRASRGRLTVQANTLWALAPRAAKPAFFEGESSKNMIDLTDIIGSKRLCSVGAKDYAERSMETVDFTVVDHGGVHLVFEAEGSSRPLDSPSILYVTDLDSECDIMVDGSPIAKGSKVKLHPGSVIDMGEGASYVVYRNVHAHA